MLAHVQTDVHKHTPPSNQSAGSPSLPAVARCSLVGCRLMDESPLSSSVKAPLYQATARMDPHIWLDPNGSQLLPVITHTAQAQDAAETTAGAQSSTRWGSLFGAKRGYYVTRVQLCFTWVVRRLAGQEVWLRGILRRVLFLFLTKELICWSGILWKRLWSINIVPLVNTSLNKVGLKKMDFIQIDKLIASSKWDHHQFHITSLVKLYRYLQV